MTHHCENRELTVAMAARYDLDAEHVSFITGSGETTNKVESILEDAQELREEAAAEASQAAFGGDPPDGADSEMTGVQSAVDGDDVDRATGDSSGDVDTEETANPEEGEKPAEQADEPGDEQAGLSDFL
jgi:replication factor C large subunit